MNLWVGTSGWQYASWRGVLYPPGVPQRRCLGCFPPGVRVAVEFRHPSWWTDETRETLAEHSAALCWADRRGRPVAPLWRTAGFTYLRLHEGTANPRPSYGRRALRTWASRVQEVLADGGDAYVYFNNDQGGAAIRNARSFVAACR